MSFGQMGPQWFVRRIVQGKTIIGLLSFITEEHGRLFDRILWNTLRHF